MVTERGTGIWWAKKMQYRFMWRNHDALYIAIGKFRLRILKLWKQGTVCRWFGHREDTQYGIFNMNSYVVRKVCKRCGAEIAKKRMGTL
mgnify:FL=1